MYWKLATGFPQGGGSMGEERAKNVAIVSDGWLAAIRFWILRIGIAHARLDYPLPCVQCARLSWFIGRQTCWISWVATDVRDRVARGKAFWDVFFKGRNCFGCTMTLLPEWTKKCLKTHLGSGICQAA